MTIEEAEEWLNSDVELDYVNGRPLKIYGLRTAGNELDVRLYDQKHGAGAAQRAINYLRASQSTS